VSFDYAFVTVAIDTVLVRFCRGRGEIDVRIASLSGSRYWYELPTILAALDEKADAAPSNVLDLQQAGRLIESNLNRIKTAFSGYDRRFTGKLEELRINERNQIRQAE
jgi:hypothetical protein